MRIRILATSKKKVYRSLAKSCCSSRGCAKIYYHPALVKLRRQLDSSRIDLIPLTLVGPGLRGFIKLPERSQLLKSAAVGFGEVNGGRLIR